MPGPVFLDGEDVELRTIETDDAAFLQQTLNDPQVRSSLTAFSPRSRTQKADWIAARDDSDGVVLLICVDGDPVGTVALNPPNDVWGVAEIAYMVAPDKWGNGYATEAVRLICRYGFEERRLNKVYAEPFATNTGSCRVLEKVGFSEEGTLRQEAFIEGEYVDVRRYGLLAEEWNQ
ncbi:Protein N-acetyltransferase, RimJ/RimL family [Halogranum rubrum]|uniref:Protein N-acetyltransferase, RimJ/RimL family n=1 Tax=Halogranum rubrum TaxID=553466 RepID=A0A1I4BDH3_9EURY|nr:GNAT family protein [Halogranum rubrum]SFK66835.1 Protein N-acetyltransferase, RimJ/RimL family [Halogranum rubrum]